ncbi:MAG: hypothetical protein JNL21_24995 [Myxococcales bacterium]|nr:hypothetical protein [Myxococcales bacterium]
MSFRRLVAALAFAPLLFVLACGEEAGGSGGGDNEGGDGQGAGGVGGQGTGNTSKPTCLTEPSGSSTPDARADTAGAFSPDGLSVVLFGGDTATVVCGDMPAREHVGDTWVLDVACGGWTEVASSGPPARARHTMATDAARGRALLFGGRTRTGSSTSYDLFNDIWAFDFASQTWSEIVPANAGPTARSNTASIVVGDVLYVFGGSTSTSGTVFNPQDDLWALDLVTNTWTELGTSGPRPPARLFHGMAGDAAAGQLYVVSGGDENAFIGPFLEDLWTFDLASGTWSESTVSIDAVEDFGRIKPALLAQPVEGGARLHYFAGHDAGQLGNRNDTNVLDVGATAWRASKPGDTFNKPGSGTCNFPPDFTTIDNTSPERRSAFAAAVHPNGQAMVIFGGDTDCGRASDAWWYDATAESWEVVRATPVGLSCLRFSSSCSGLCG